MTCWDFMLAGFQLFIQYMAGLRLVNEEKKMKNVRNRQSKKNKEESMCVSEEMKKRNGRKLKRGASCRKVDMWTVG